MNKAMERVKKEEAVDGEAGYCVCNEPATESSSMVICGACNKWYHIKCVLKDEDASLLSKYICSECQEKTGSKTKWKGKAKKKRKQEEDEETHVDSNEKKSPKKIAREDPDAQDYSPKKQNNNTKVKDPAAEPIRRSARTKVKHNYSELNDGHEQEMADKSIVVDYVKMLKKAHCIKSSSIPHRMRGEDLTLEFLATNGFREPLVVDNMEALDMKMPPSTITIQRISELVGNTRLLDVMEVPTQAEVDPKWTLEQWAEYYHTPIAKRQRILNVISLEVSKTPLNAQIRTPRIVREIDWIDQVWPHRLKASAKYPQVQVYCLMSVQNAYTDFHIDFGGSSVWYHVIKGKKVFYLIPPTQENLEKYATWSSSPRQSKVWFGNLVPTCYEAHVEPGQTFFIPTGWIHAVFTPEDSLVFGGNFLHGLNCRLQLEIYDIEQTTHVPDKFRFPLFRQLIWFAAIHYTDIMKEKGVDALNKWEQDSARAIMDTLDIWLMDSVKAQKAKVRNPESVIDDLHRLLDNESAESAQKKREQELKVKISKEDLLKSGGEDMLRDVGENDLLRSGEKLEQAKIKPKAKSGRPRKFNKSTPSSSPSPSTTPSSSSPTTPASTSPSPSTHSPFGDFYNIIKNERISPVSAPFPFTKQYNNSYPSPSASPLYSAAPYSHNLYNHDSYKQAASFAQYPSSSYPSHYKVYNPPAPSRHPPSSSPSPRAQFSDLLHLTNAAESLENESNSPYKPYNYDNEYTYPPRNKYYENGNYYENTYNNTPRYTNYMNPNTHAYANTKPSASFASSLPPYPSDPFRSARYPPPSYHEPSNGYKYPPSDYDFRTVDSGSRTTDPGKPKSSLSFILNSRDNEEENAFKVTPLLPPLSNH